MYILGIETSCDETSAAVIEGSGSKIKLLSNVISSSLIMHGKTGGIIPENAAREQIKFIIPVIQEALAKAFDRKSKNRVIPDYNRESIDSRFRGNDKLSTIDYFNKIDAIALTYGPGLIGSLLVGVETAKTISYVFDKPIIPVNHMLGHIYANFVSERSKIKDQRSKLTPNNSALNPDIKFPAIALVVSGGHTDLLLLRGHGYYQLLGGTRDDAAGEAFDKTSRLLGLPYPGGPEIEKAALKADHKRFRFPRPLIGSPDFDFSFSGLKSAVLRETQTIGRLDDQTVNDLAFATQDAIVDVLVRKTLKAALKYTAECILISGGVSANQALRERFEIESSKYEINFFAPEKLLCTDNAAMIASAAYFNKQSVAWEKITADPELYFE